MEVDDMDGVVAEGEEVLDCLSSYALSVLQEQHSAAAVAVVVAAAVDVAADVVAAFALPSAAVDDKAAACAFG